MQFVSIERYQYQAISTLYSSVNAAQSPKIATDWSVTRDIDLSREIKQF